MPKKISFWKDWGSLKEILFSFKGRISRRQFVISYLIFVLSLTFISIFLFSLLQNNFLYLSFLFLIILAFSVYVNIVLNIKRFHDFGMKGINILWFFVPFLNIYFFFKLLLEKGEKKDNSYGKKIIHHYKINKSYLFLGIFTFATIVFFSFSAIIVGIIRNSDSFQYAKTIIENSEEIQKEYGEVKLGLLPMGEIYIKNGETNADLKIKIFGEKKNGIVKMKLKKKNEEFVLEKFELE